MLAARLIEPVVRNFHRKNVTFFMAYGVQFFVVVVNVFLQLITAVVLFVFSQQQALCQRNRLQKAVL